MCGGGGGGCDDFRTPNIIVEALRSYPTRTECHMTFNTLIHCCCSSTFLYFRHFPRRLFVLLNWATTIMKQAFLFNLSSCATFLVEGTFTRTVYFEPTQFQKKTKNRSFPNVNFWLRRANKQEVWKGDGCSAEFVEISGLSRSGRVRRILLAFCLGRAAGRVFVVLLHIYLGQGFLVIVHLEGDRPFFWNIDIFHLLNFYLKF